MNEIKKAFQSIRDAEDADLFVFSGTIDDNAVDQFIEIVRNKENRRKNCALILTTYGGDPDAGYRVVRCIKRYYTEFILYVFGTCKSTGTLIALGSNKIVMSDFGEFGPLDIQMTKDDELSNTSGLSYLQSLVSLQEQMFRCFEVNFMSLKRGSSNTITTRTAAEIGSKLAIGLLSPISAQLDPVKLGEVQRAIKIADTYGSRINEDKKLISKLITSYPSHGFVIDFEEAETIFPNVRFVNQSEAFIERSYIGIFRRPAEKVVIFDIDLALKEEQEESAEEKQTEDQKQETNDQEKNLSLPHDNTTESVQHASEDGAPENTGASTKGEKP